MHGLRRGNIHLAVIAVAANDSLMDEYLHGTGLTLPPQMVSNSYEVLTDFVWRAHGVTFQIRPEKGASKINEGLAAIPIAELTQHARPMVLG